ncbi:MAG: ribonuclease HIII [Ignavibacteria bacterium]
MLNANSELIANQIAQELNQKFKIENYLVTEVSKGNYNYNFQIKKPNEVVKVLVFYGKNGHKIILQGNPDSKLYKEINSMIFSSINENEPVNSEKEKIDEPEFYIGVDESGKGDFFGPLIIAGFYTTPEIKKELIQLNVQDSKTLSDQKVSEIARALKEKFSDYLTIVKIYPKKYNELYSKIGNLNTLLAWGHSRCIENILSKHKVPVAICDQFGNENFIKNALMKEGKKIELIQTTKAERFTGVAAASILARNAFLEWITKAEEKIGMKIPKGANEVVKETARKIIERLGRESLSEFVKAHFKTMNEL